MSPLRLPLERIEPAASDLTALEERARELAERPGERADAAEQKRLVVRFPLAGAPLAVESRELQQVVARLGPVRRIPGEKGRSHLIAFLQDRPLPVFDLMSVEGRERPEERLGTAPALVLRDEDGPIACAVEGPLNLVKLGVRRTADEGARRARALPLAAELSDGALLLEAAALRRLISRQVRGGRAGG